MKTFSRITLIVLVLAVMVTACTIIDPCGCTVCTGTAIDHVTMVMGRTATAYEATAEYGADQLYIELTAQAEEARP